MFLFAVGKVAPRPFWPCETQGGGTIVQDAEGGIILSYIERPTHAEMRIDGFVTLNIAS
jgi:hypothetical protein